MKSEGKIHDGYKKGWLVCSGFIGQKSYHPKHMHWVIGEMDMEKSIKILPEAIENYKKDEWRKSDNILEKSKGKNQYYPCFYTTNGIFVNSFGNTGFYRCHTEKKVGDLLPSVHNDKNIIDYN